jgi:hypothetical protein
MHKWKLRSVVIVSHEVTVLGVKTEYLEPSSEISKGRDYQISGETAEKSAAA